MQKKRNVIHHHSSKQNKPFWNGDDGLPLKDFTQHCKFGHGATAFLHLTDIDGIIVGGDIVNSEAAQGTLHIHAVLGAFLQTGLLHKPASLCVRHWYLTLQSCRFLFLHLNILQLPLEWNLWLWQGHVEYSEYTVVII